ncbi:hypothetical protein L6164_010433 [Bauhinia variegata]|uniref:Uncharacterized protein n=1 Tax=Bauhinia variegata TaxID=167791 RepID=A0ACB9PMW7_BAUVA|nr:hypothetical protein L6164_010433 [Bauhinia variegata]
MSRYDVNLLTTEVFPSTQCVLVAPIAEDFLSRLQFISGELVDSVVLRWSFKGYIGCGQGFFSKSTPYAVKVGIPEFLNGIGNGVESHVVKVESEVGDFHKLLVTRTLKLKKLGIPCKHILQLFVHLEVFMLCHLADPNSTCNAFEAV